MGKINKFEAEMLYSLLGELRKNSETIDQKNENEWTKEQKIKIVKQRYNEKNAIWRFFHKKLNPAKKNLDNMSNEQIEALTHTIMYGNGGKSK